MLVQRCTAPPPALGELSGKFVEQSNLYPSWPHFVFVEPNENESDWDDYTVDGWLAMGNYGVVMQQPAHCGWVHHCG